MKIFSASVFLLGMSSWAGEMPAASASHALCQCAKYPGVTSLEQCTKLQDQEAADERNKNRQAAMSNVGHQLGAGAAPASVGNNLPGLPGAAQ